MNQLITVLFVTLLCLASGHEIGKRSLFSWGSETKAAEPDTPTGYLPILKVHKYNGIQINPIQGPPVYIPNGPSESNDLDGNAQINAEQVQQLDFINKLASFLPEDKFQEVDLNALLPYVDLISEDTIDKIKYALETTKTNQKPKLLKFLAFIKSIKEKKLKPFKYAASVGNKIVHKKKALLFGAPTTTPEPYTETPPTITYSYNNPYNPYIFQNKQFYNTFAAPASSESSFPFQSYPYPAQYQSVFQFNTQSKTPSNLEIPQYQFNPESYQLKLPSSPSAPQYPPFQGNFQYTELPRAPSNQYQFSASLQQAELPTFPANQYQPQHPSFAQSSAEPPKQDAVFDYKQPTTTFPASQYQPQNPLPQPSAEPSKNDVVYEYKQPPASTFATQDINVIRQFASSPNSSDYQFYTASPTTPRVEVSSEQYYSLPSNFVHPFNFPSQPIASLKFPLSSLPTFQSNQEANKFFFGTQDSVPNDLMASGSENIEKINDQIKPESKSNIEKESIKSVNDLATSTEITVSKSKTFAGKRTLLRPVTPKAPVYEASSNDETTKGDDSISSPANTASVH